MTEAFRSLCLQGEVYFPLDVFHRRNLPQFGLNLETEVGCGASHGREHDLPPPPPASTS